MKYTANGEGVFNPSVQSAWLQIDDERIVEVPGGIYVDLTVV